MRNLHPGPSYLLTITFPEGFIPAPQNCVLMGEEEWEVSRVLAGRPAPGRELGLPGGPTPLEAGLYHAVSLRKVIRDPKMRTLSGWTPVATGPLILTPAGPGLTCPGQSTFVSLSWYQHTVDLSTGAGWHRGPVPTLNLLPMHGAQVIGHPGLRALADAEARGQQRQLWGLQLQV